jgi:predicted site-specific integrase-resolvase
MARKIMRDPDSLSTFDVADILGIARTTFRHWVLNNKIPMPSTKIGARWKWTRAEVTLLKKRITG